MPEGDLPPHKCSLSAGLRCYGKTVVMRLIEPSVKPIL